ncbi:MAG: hypothetical protein AMJ94_00785 [Deltaproteobacteria bacterium SM23_61]|nr:MAG: hypothetical protein AMJ94_00785 [Deltaproteobacteria bacterium SM23_61]
MLPLAIKGGNLEKIQSWIWKTLLVVQGSEEFPPLAGKFGGTTPPYKGLSPISALPILQIIAF